MDLAFVQGKEKLVCRPWSMLTGLHGQQQAPTDQHAVIFHVIQKPNPIINTQYAVINKLL